MHKIKSIYSIACAGFEDYISNLPILDQFLKVHTKEKEYVIDFALAVHEAVSNALCYGNGGYHKAKVKVTMKRKGDRLYARIVSDNNGFDVEQQISKVNYQLLNNAWDFESPRGRGLPIMGKVCSGVWFNAAGNQVLLVLDIGARADEYNIGCELKTTGIWSCAG